MNNYRLFPTLLLSVSLLFSSDHSVAQEIRVAVASNFTGAMKKLVEDFEANSDHTVTLSFGSTGKHFAQIKNGAPFHAFFAADIHRPQILEQEGIAVAGSRFTYAVGKLVLWSPRAGYVDASASILERGDFRFLAIANPILAPYGKAAEEVLLARGLWSGLAGRLVRGENISQALQFVRSGNAELGFVAYSQVQRLDRSIEGSYWIVPQGLYTPIAQQVVLLRENEATRAFLLFVRSPQASNIIRAHGYDTPR